MPVWGDDPAVLRCDHRPDTSDRGPDHDPCPDDGRGPEPDDPRTGRARTAAEVLGWSRRLLDPALRDAVERMPGAVRDIAAFHFGWRDERGLPAAGGGGKAIRPALTLLAAEAVGGTASAALPAAVAVELAHNFSLLHDDVMDGDLTRRHRPTAWTVYGANPAILAGDALLAAAFEVLADEPSPLIPRAVRTLAQAVRDLVAGQSADLAFEERSDVTLDECAAMAGRKTGALLGAACALGAAYGGGTTGQAARLRAFGERLGLAFQLVDDLLGIWGDPGTTGKPVHSDLHSRKKSLPVVAALTSGTPAGAELAELYFRDGDLTGDDASRAAALVDTAGGRAWAATRAATLLTTAEADLAAAGLHPTTATELRALAHLITHRNH
ncbi:family 2 encapsulin nanocompartment cargo protein polyprenyl transferase [Actinomadura livida]|uniref:Family 2 encapsulin nanocompartment cargo protein polyprenyl transferase n=1 Tax=Actinomadura livida TaxID=79909 RepID=A0A7W7N0U3_9ACTN|nr:MULTISPECIES: family 2 encapsulin nanocompartment cargo protein polyprenyl transferase [Actinomadura]MBB4777469.1 geranylgeranyl diphosphate synthase type I [Actinomadura catellatispora]GGU31301.1 dimethylallyltransferase [Actinomadura livida]